MDQYFLKPIFILSLLICCLDMNGQKIKELMKFKEQQKLINEADSLPNEKMKESILLYEKAGAVFELDDFAKYTLACMYAYEKNTSMIYKYLNSIGYSKFLFCGTDTSEYCMLSDILNEELFNFMHGEEQWEQLIRSRKEEIKKRYAQLDKEVISELKEMYNNDQKYRLYMVNNWKEIYSPGHKKELDSLLGGQDLIDSLNFIRLKELTMKHGWLGYSKYGRFSEILITHVNKDFDYFLPLMVDAARKGELEWTHVDICVKRKMSCLLLSDNGAELDDIYFNSKSGALLPESNYQLDVLLNELELLKGYAKTIVISASYNKNESLSKKRIENIVKYLKEKRFDTSIIVQNNVYDKGLKRESKIIVKVITKK